MPYFFLYNLHYRHHATEHFVFRINRKSVVYLDTCMYNDKFDMFFNIYVVFINLFRFKLIDCKTFFA